MPRQSVHRVPARFSVRSGALACASAALLAAAFAQPALADVKAGVDAWSAGDYARAVTEWQGPAAANDPDALFNLAQAYRLGRGVEADNTRARRLYEQAAQLGHVKAADNFGLLLFQEGEQSRAMPLIEAAAGRGDPRAQYVLGLSHFNADYAPRDWVRAYALMTLAHGQGLPQAAEALKQMDKYVPKAQRAQAQSVAREIDTGAQRQRAAALTAADLAAADPAARPVAARPAGGPAATRPGAAAPALAAATPAPASVRAAATPAPVRAAPTAIAAVTPVASSASGAQRPARGGSWRVQLGAFGVAGNADRLWRELGSHAALAGTAKALVPSGNLTRLLATGFASESEAARACAALKREGKACVVAGQG